MHNDLEKSFLNRVFGTLPGILLVMAVTGSLLAPDDCLAKEEPAKGQHGGSSQEVADPKASLQAKGAQTDTVARVNGEPVTRAELQGVLADPMTRSRFQQELGVEEPKSQELDRLALRLLIKRRLMLQEAGRRNLTVTEQELDDAVTALRGRFKDLRSFGAWTQEQGLNDNSLFDTLRAEMLAARVVAALVREVRVTGEQVEEYYEAHKKELKTDGEVRLRIIAVKERTAAEGILAELRQGANFAALARKWSLGMRAAQGGDTGWVKPQALAPQLRKSVAALKAGEAGGPLQAGAEFLIVGLVGRRAAEIKSLAEARPEIEKRLVSKKQQETIQAWLTEQEQKSKIEVFL